MNKPLLIAVALLLPVVAGARTAEPATSPPQACLSPAEMAALLPSPSAIPRSDVGEGRQASREQAEDFYEASDARTLERVRAVLRLLGRHLGRSEPAPDATAN